MSNVWKRAAASAMVSLALAACGGSDGPKVSVDVSPAPPVTLTKSAGLNCSGNTCDLRLYQIMVEAFIDGDSTRNYNTGYGSSHHKGDLKGIINSLDYIQGLGVNAIWLTPIFESKAHSSGNDDRLDATGYFPSNYFKIDPKFGTEEDLKTLVEGAHARGMYVFLDGVFGHYKSNIVTSPSGLSPKSTDDCIKTDGSTQKALPGTACADYSSTQTQAFFKEVATYWIKNYKIDGWRLDQAYQVPVRDWGWLRGWVEHASSTVTYTDQQSKAVNPLGYMVAEIWSGEDRIRETAYGSDASPALRSAFDFPLRYALVQTLAGEEDTGSGKVNLPASTLAAGYATNGKYPAHAVPNLMLGNHDLVRFGDLIQRAGLGDPGQGVYWDRHKAAFSFLAAHSGPITIYYGDEIGQELAGFAARVDDTICGGLGQCDDHVSRTSGMVEGLPSVVGGPVTVLNADQKNLKDYLATLMQIRSDNPALSIGTRTHVSADASVYIDRKEAGSNRVLYVLNAKPGDRAVRVTTAQVGGATVLTDLVSGEIINAAGGEFNFNVTSLSARFLRY